MLIAVLNLINYLGTVAVDGWDGEGGPLVFWLVHFRRKLGSTFFQVNKIYR